MTVYLITNLKNGKYYVGHTRGLLRDRWQTHKSEANTRPKWPIHLAIREFGAESFVIEPLYRGDDRGEAIAMEALWTRLLSSHDPEHGYNVSVGYRLSPTTRRRMAASRSGRSLTPEHRAAVSRGNLGKPKSEAHKAALRAARQRVLAQR